MDKCDQSSLFGHWRLVKAPISCRQSILECCWLGFSDNGRISVYDTGNSSSAKYLLADTAEDGKSGVVIMKCKWWTQRCRLWPSKEERIEAENVDELISSLMRKLVNYELKDDMLILTHEGKECQFVKIIQNED